MLVFLGFRAFMFLVFFLGFLVFSMFFGFKAWGLRVQALGLRS